MPRKGKYNSSAVKAFGFALAEYVNHPDYDKGRWAIIVEGPGWARKRVCANKTTAEAWQRYLRRKYGSPLLSGISLTIRRVDPLPGFPKSLDEVEEVLQ